MNPFGTCPFKGMEMEIRDGYMAGETIIVEDWAREVLEKGVEWPSDIGNPSVLMFLVNRKELLDEIQSNKVEYLRVCLTGIYGHVGWSGCIVLPEELGRNCTTE